MKTWEITLTTEIILTCLNQVAWWTDSSQNQWQSNQLYLILFPVTFIAVPSAVIMPVNLTCYLCNSKNKYWNYWNLLGTFIQNLSYFVCSLDVKLFRNIFIFIPWVRFHFTWGRSFAALIQYIWLIFLRSKGRFSTVHLAGLQVVCDLFSS